MVEGLKALKRGLEEPDFTVLFRTCTNIAMVRWAVWGCSEDPAP